MAERSKVRLVRCPKCDNLLPELPDYSVYQCGGCGVVLRAKKKVSVTGGFMEKPGKEREEEMFQKLESLSEKEDVNITIASETELESDGALHVTRKDRVVRERFANSLSSKAEKEEGSVDNRSRIEEEPGGIDHNGKYKHPLKHPIDSWVHHPDDHDNANMTRSESVNSNRGNGSLEPQFTSSAGASRSRARWGLDGTGLGEHYGNIRKDDDCSKFSMFAYPDHEGRSKYQLGSSSSTSYKPEKIAKNYDGMDGPNGFAYLEQDRGELVRKLEELKEQLSRPCTVAEKQWDRNSVDSRRGPLDNYRGCANYNVSMQPAAPDKHVPEAPPYLKQYNHEHVPYASSHDVDTQRAYLRSKNSPNKIPGYFEPFQQRIPGLDAYQSPRQYHQPPPQDYHFPRHYAEFNQEPLASHHLEHPYHQPACSCFRCYKENLHVTSQVPPDVFGNPKFPKDPMDLNFNRQVNAATFGAQGYYSHQANLPALHSRQPEPYVIWPSDIDSDIEGFRLNRPRRVMVAHGNARRCRPLAGAAPFITCSNCFELLNLPRELKIREKIQQKLRCGACSQILLLKIENKRLISTVLGDENRTPGEADDESCDISKEVLLSSDGPLNISGTNCFDDYRSPDYDFGSADFKDNMASVCAKTPSKDQKPNTSELDRRLRLTSSYVPSEEDESQENTIVAKDVSYAECLDDAPSTRAVDRHGKGNRSKRTDLDKDMLVKTTSRQNSVKDASVATTEVEVSFNDYLNGSVSQDSLEIKKDEDWSGTNKGRESLFMGFIKKSLRDLSRSNQHLMNAKAKVFINGHHIPDRVVKKAEKLAGPIHPGNYWYDYRAGFWGVIGHPCLGIIPPYIEEFNYPLPENCAAGNTGVFVNGRELNQKDLDMLVSRGLPTIREKFYIISISGKVVDEDSGEELVRLGRLAPTVEKMKRGFGMKVPRRLSQ